MTPTCINLRERFGQQYRITFDDAAENKNDPWMMTIHCWVGTFYPHGGEMLTIELDSSGQGAKGYADSTS